MEKSMDLGIHGLLAMVDRVTVQKVKNGWVICAGEKTFVAYRFDEMVGVLEEQFNIIKVVNDNGEIKKVQY